MIGGEAEIPGNILINFGLFIIAFRVAVIVHEAGHLIAARLAGGVPRRMVLGNGHEVYRTRILGIDVIVNSRLAGAYAGAWLNDPKLLRLRYAFFILGGVLLNALVALMFYGLFGFGLYDPQGQVSVAVPSIIILANSAMVYNLVPFYGTGHAIKIPSDGLALLKLPFTNKKEIRKHLDANLLFDGIEFMERKEYQKAWNAFSEYQEKYPDSHILTLNLAIILLKTGQPEKSLEVAATLLDRIDDKEIKRYRGLIYNMLGWTHLVLNNVEQADHFSSLAIKAIPNDNGIRATRGSVLVRKGLVDQGMALLSHSMDFKFVNNAMLSAAIYLMLAWHLKGNAKDRDTYREFVERNASKLDPDERVLFERNLQMVNDQPLSPALKAIVERNP